MDCASQYLRVSWLRRSPRLYRFWTVTTSTILRASRSGRGNFAEADVADLSLLCMRRSAPSDSSSGCGVDAVELVELDAVELEAAELIRRIG